MKKLLSVLFLVNINLWAINTNGYQEIIEIKVWPTAVDVYIPSVNECSKTNLKKIRG